jgi:Bacterial regulatory helix-turn-helix protein, lysR family
MALFPSLETLRVFEVACRHGSYSEAARELHVTHSAVSQRIRQLEEELGLTLFERQGGPLAGSAPSSFQGPVSAHQSARQDRSVAGQFQVGRRRHRNPVRDGRLERTAGNQASR